MTARSATVAAQTGSGLVLLTLASGQFLMTLDSSVMNVSIATVAKDLGTDVTGVQGHRRRRRRHRRRQRAGPVDGLRAALFVLALIAFLGLFAARRIPTRQPTSAAAPAATGP
jgi:hypothetical protein